MPRSRLLIVDGESLRSPGLVKALEREGWEQEWANGAHASHSLPGGGPPDLLLLDPRVITPQGVAAVASLRLRSPGLGAVLLGGAGQSEAFLREAGLEPRAVKYLDPSLPVASWPATLRSCLGVLSMPAEKFTAEDLFGDILAEISLPAVLPPGRVPENLYTLSDLEGMEDPFSAFDRPDEPIPPPAPAPPPPVPPDAGPP